MAGTMVHMLTAKYILEELPPENRILCDSAFYVGNFTPDVIQVREGYKREWKLHTHFRDAIRDDAFAQKDNLKLFESRLEEFAKRELGKWSTNKERYAFTLGYITHMLTDEYFMCSIREEFMEKIAVLGLTQYDAKTFEHFTFDVNQIDFRIAATEEGMDDVCKKIRTAPVFAVDEMLSIEEVEAGRKWVLQMYYDSKPAYTEPVYLSYERMTAFAKDAAKRIVKELSGCKFKQ